MLTRLRHPGRSQDEGLTLAEMLVALGLISTALFALLGGFLTSAKSIQGQQENSRATRVALDRNETLRLSAFDSPELAVGVHNGSSTTPDGRTYTYTTTVSERDALPTDAVAGDVVKEIRTVVQWTADGRTREVAHTTAVAQDARTVGLPSAYEQAIRSITVSPDPSASVNFNGNTSVPIVVTVVMSGHGPSDVVTVSWTDDSGARTATATTTDARYWRVTIPAGPTGIKKLLAQRQRFDLGFRATTATGLTASTTLAVFGPVDDAPVITSWTVSPTPIATINGGNNRRQNRFDVTFTCQVTGLSTAATTTDSVKARYIGETGAPVETVLTRTAVSGTTTTWSKTFARSTTYFGVGSNQPYTCIVSRASDGGPASKVVNVTVTG